jgi:hypothetical protein
MIYFNDYNYERRRGDTFLCCMMFDRAVLGDLCS